MILMIPWIIQESLNSQRKKRSIDMWDRSMHGNVANKVSNVHAFSVYVPYAAEREKRTILLKCSLLAVK